MWFIESISLASVEAAASAGSLGRAPAPVPDRGDGPVWRSSTGQLSVESGAKLKRRNSGELMMKLKVLVLVRLW